MEMVTKIVVALCMFTTQSGDVPMEHLYVKDGYGKCLQLKREAERNTNPERIRWVCGEVEAMIEVDSMGNQHINKIIKPKG